jgi:hypothetical protein
MERRLWGTLTALGLCALGIAGLEGSRERVGQSSPSPGIYTREELAIARENVARYDWARAQREQAERDAKPWIEMSDAQLRQWVTPPEVPRAFRVHEDGCPVHGKEVYRFGYYPWIVSLDTPWKIKCPVGSESYPSNDFGAFLRSGREKRSLLTGDYADDGWGWRKEGASGAKYWFVAYYNHWAVWRRGLLPGLKALGTLYRLTENPRYGHAAAVLLLKIAEEHPRYDYATQSREGTEISKKYVGGVLNNVWETERVTTLADTYDAIYPSLSADRRLQEETGLSARAIAERIEAHILQDAAHHIMRTDKILGNYGMHQEALLTIALALRETGRSPARDTMIRWVGEGGGLGIKMDVRTALNNLVFRDGVPDESPGYNALWVKSLTSVARLLKRAGADVFREPRFRSLYDWPLELVVLGQMTPALGDSGSMFPRPVNLEPDLYLTAFREYRDARYARLSLGPSGQIAGRDLYERPLDEEVKRATVTATAPPAVRSRLFPAYGFASLQTGGKEGTAATLSFPQYRGHRHHDFLDLGIYAMGKALTPDFGYPETASLDDPRRFGFFYNTVSHNTVMVDAADQTESVPYRLHAYDQTPVLQRVDVSAPDAYPGKMRSYRRCIALIPIDTRQAYVADFFHVAGGKQHDWLVHGSQATFQSDGLKVPPPAPGTLAGPDVPYGFFYDEPRLQNLPQGSSYLGYKGSGFQYLMRPQAVKDAPGTYRVEWRWTRDATPGHLSLWCVGEREEAIVCAGKPQNFKPMPEEVTFLIRRRQSTGGRPLESVFASVFEPFADAPKIRKVERVALTPAKAGAVGLRVLLPGRTDLLVFGAGNTEVATPSGTRVRGALAYLSVGADGKVARAYVSAGGSIQSKGIALTAPAPALKAASADWRRHWVTLDGPLPESVKPGQVVLFGEGAHAYEVRRIDRVARRIELGDQECIVARGEVDASARGSASSEKETSADSSVILHTATFMPHARAGMHLLDESGHQSWRIQKIDSGTLVLSPRRPLPSSLRRFQIVDYGPGDAVAFSSPAVFP